MPAQDGGGTSGVLVEVYLRDVVMRRDPKAQIGGGKRGAVTSLTEEARGRLRFVALNARVQWEAWCDLTYPAIFPRAGEVVKGHLNRLLTELRQRSPGVAYLWVLEFQERGAPHFHMLVDRRVEYEWLASAWFRIVNSGDPAHRQAGTSVSPVRCRDAAAIYLSKYLGKDAQKALPRDFGWPGRFWGCSRGLLGDPNAYYIAGGKNANDAVRTMRTLAEKKAGRRLRVTRRGCGFTIFGGSVAGERVGRTYGTKV